MKAQLLPNELPLPPHFDSTRVAEIWRVPYEDRASAARQWAHLHHIKPASEDSFRISLVLVDVQNTFCIPGFELFVGGRSGKGALDDNLRLAQFIYRYLGSITEITATLDTHHAAQIFNSIFLINERGEHPAPYTLVSATDIQQGKWRFNGALARSLGISPDYGQRHLLHYTEELASSGKYDLTIWPYHAMVGGIGHALVASIEEAIFFHAFTRYSTPDYTIKGFNPLTEHYSVVGPEVLDGPDGKVIDHKSNKLLSKLQNFDIVLIAGQAKSHCVAWTVADLLEECQKLNPELVKKIYLLEDCTSPVVIPGAIDYTEQAEADYQRFAQAGMHLVRSTDPITTWLEG
jgi:nicotinamidase-related amidase